MTRHHGRTLALLGVLGLVAAPAAAQQNVAGWGSFAFDNYCISGAFPVCASVRVFADGNNLTMQVWNLEGVLGTPHTITAVGLYHSGAAWTGDVNSFNAYYVTGGGTTNITNRWHEPSSDIGTLAGVDVEASTGSTGNNGVIGCTNPGGGTKWSTCGSFPGTPYVQFDFSLSNSFALNDLELRWHSQQVLDENGQYENSLKCDTGGAGDYPDCSVVPEPVTMALLATGLAGIGGAGFLRRRRRGHEITSD